MKLNGTPRHYMPLSQNQSDDEENGTKTVKYLEKCCQSSDFPESFDKTLKLPKQNNIVKKCSPMSPWRTVAFSLSLCMCFVFIAAFLFLVPCRPEALGVGNIGDLLEKWTTLLPNISLSSNIALAVTSYFSSPLIIFGYLRWENATYFTKGVLAIRKSDGVEIWRIPLHSVATSVLCNSIDVNGDGVYDCLITGKNGLLTAVDIQKGINIWYIHSHKIKKLAVNISEPMLLPDCDEDAVPDLAVSYKSSVGEKSVFLILVSGAKGEVIGSPIPLLHCTSRIIGQTITNMRNKTGFMFYCHSGKAGQLFLSFVKDICDVAYNRTDSMGLTVLYRYPDVIQPTINFEFQMITTSVGDMIILIGGSQVSVLAIEKVGKVRVMWQKTFKNDSLWRFVAQGSFLDRSSSELVFLATDKSVSQMVGLDVSSGYQIWYGTFNNSLVTSVLTVPKFFRDDDGIILKLLKPAHGHMEKNLEFPSMKFQYSNETTKDVSFSEPVYGLAEESFVLVHVKDLPRAKIISLEEIWQNCKADICQPDIYAWERTAVAETLNTGEVDVSIVSSSAVQKNYSVSWKIQTSVKLLKIEKFSKFSTCMYSLDS